MDITIRLDVLTDTDAETLIKYLDKYERYLVYEEIADKTKKLHYQGIIRVDDEKHFNSAKVRFTQMFPSHKGGSKSMSKVIKKTYEVYITKDGKIFQSRGYTPDEIAELASKSYKKDSNVHVTGFSAIYHWVRDNGVTHASHPKDILCVLIDYYREHQKCEPTDFQLKNMTMSIYGKLLYENNVERYENYKRRRADDILRSIIF